MQLKWMNFMVCELSFKKAVVFLNLPSRLGIVAHVQIGGLQFKVNPGKKTLADTVSKKKLAW
jgi:hypothetical protein